MAHERYRCYEVSDEGVFLGQVTEVVVSPGSSLEEIASYAANIFAKQACLRFLGMTHVRQPFTIYVRVHSDDEGMMATIQFTGRWEWGFEYTAKPVPSSIPS